MILDMLQREEYDDPDEPIGYIGNVGGKEVAYPLKPTRNAESKYKRKWCWECRKSFSSSTNLKEHQVLNRTFYSRNVSFVKDPFVYAVFLTLRVTMFSFNR